MVIMILPHKENQNCFASPHSILDIQARREECWAKLIRDRTLLPADIVKLYDPDGKLIARLLYKDNEVTSLTSTG